MRASVQRGVDADGIETVDDWDACVSAAPAVPNEFRTAAAYVLLSLFP